MKIWKEFNSSHSSNVTIVGTFEDVGKAKSALKIVEDFALSSWEERYPTLKEFIEYWSVNFRPDAKYSGLLNEEYDTGIDNTPTIEVVGNTIKVSKFRTGNYGGILKLMRLAGAHNIVIDERPI